LHDYIEIVNKKLHFAQKTGHLASRQTFHRDTGQTGWKTGRPGKTGRVATLTTTTTTTTIPYVMQFL